MRASAREYVCACIRASGEGKQETMHVLVVKFNRRRSALSFLPLPTCVCASVMGVDGGFIPRTPSEAVPFRLLARCETGRKMEIMIHNQKQNWRREAKWEVQRER